jgi:hypothetical protein
MCDVHRETLPGAAKGSIQIICYHSFSLFASALTSDDLHILEKAE